MILRLKGGGRQLEVLENKVIRRAFGNDR